MYLLAKIKSKFEKKNVCYMFTIFINIIRLMFVINKDILFNKLFFDIIERIDFL